MRRSLESLSRSRNMDMSKDPEALLIMRISQKLLKNI